MKKRAENPMANPPAPASFESDRTIKILLADDHLVVRQGLAAIIATEPGLQVIGQASDGEETCLLHARLQPDVLILDLRMPILDGFEVVKRLIGIDPATRILVMTTYDTDEDIWRCLRAGAKGYLLKDATQPEIVAAIRTVARGESFTTPVVALQLTRRAAVPSLTPRELEVLQHLARGQTNKEIAAALDVGAGTVKSHLKTLFEKLGVSTRSEALSYANKRGLIRLD